MISIADSSATAHARREAMGVAASGGFDADDSGRVALVTTELCSNLLKHAGGGELLVRLLDTQPASIELLSLDKGPGMTDVAQCLRDGYSTGGSPGTGLGAIERLSQVFDIYSQPDRGTVVYSRLEQKRQARVRTPAAMDLGVVVLPKHGERECGDHWCHTERPQGCTLIGIDGLGHGPLAAQAAREACRVFLLRESREPARILEDIHGALRSTRGAAVTIVDIDYQDGRVTVAAIGNVAAALVTDGVVKRLASDNGIVGHTVSKFRELTYPCNIGTSVILHSDGLTGNWQLERYPGLIQHRSSVVAGVLYRDATRGRDDSLVIVAKREAP